MKNFNPILMKKPALILVISTLTAVVLISGCNSPDQKMENAQSEVVDEANRELEQANQEYLADMNQYREEAADKIAANDSTITALKAQMANKTADVKADFENQLALLEQKNSDMKKKLAEYKGEGKEQWQTFKTTFNREMNTLSEAFNELTNRIS